MAPIGSEKVNRAALAMDIKAVLYEIHRSNLTEISIGDCFDLLLKTGSRHGVDNPGEFFLLTRTFIILESMIREFLITIQSFTFGSSVNRYCFPPSYSNVHY
jgi:ubiquinone biosynthesis protein